jgi:hypothetical protein
MNLVVLPLSAIGRTAQFTPVSLANGLFIHAFGVGLPSALAASLVPATPIFASDRQN